MTKPIRRIAFTGDIFRPSAGSFRPTQNENIVWLSKLLSVPLNMATGLPSVVVHWDNNWLSKAKIDSDFAKAAYQGFWLQPNIRSWAYIYNLDRLPPFLESVLYSYFEDSLVIGFEIPPYLASLFNKFHLPFIDVSMSPIRFLPDVIFEMSSNVPSISESLSKHKVSEAVIELTAGVLTSHVAKGNRAPPRPDTMLVVLQTPFDKVVINKGRFDSILNYISELRHHVSRHSSLLIKEHPVEAQPDIVARLRSEFPHAQVTEENFYRLISHDNLRSVVALSSSCVSEARYFGKIGSYLIPDAERVKNVAGLRGVNIAEEIIVPDFWRDILEGLGLDVSRKDGLRLPVESNRFRKQLRSAWGYNQIDTDIVVKWAAP